MTTPDWNPETYGRFGDLRLQPAIDLLARVGALPPGDIVDLGCGAGVMAPFLKRRFPGRRLVGVDPSPAMRDKAAATGDYDAIAGAGADDWVPDAPPALIYSNAALQWQDDHARVLPRLARLAAPGGWLAVQMPHQNPAPSHRLWLDLAARVQPGWTPPADLPDILQPAEYHRLLAPLGGLSLWETEYFQQLAPSQDAHPVRRFTEATFARPVLASLSEDAQRDALPAIYDDEAARIYPAEPDGSVLFPFRRLFFTLHMP